MSDSLSKLSKSINRESTPISVNLPGIKLEAAGSLLNAIPEVDRTVKKLANKINKAVDKVKSAIQTAYCIGSVATDPSLWLGMINTMAATASAVASNIAKRFSDMIKGQITQTLAQVSTTVNKAISSVTGYINALASFVNSLQSVLDALSNFSLNIKLDAELEWEDFKIQEDCEYMFAMMAACLFNKLGGNKLLEFEKKVSTQIDNLGNSITDAVANSLSDVDNMSNFLEHQQYHLEKADKQVQGVANLINGASSKQKESNVSINARVKLSVAQAEAENENKTASAPITGNTLSQLRDAIQKKRNK
jgi:ribosome-associated translation inhibitor RaiA